MIKAIVIVVCIAALAWVSTLLSPLVFTVCLVLSVIAVGIIWYPKPKPVEFGEPDTQDTPEQQRAAAVAEWVDRYFNGYYDRFRCARDLLELFHNEINKKFEELEEHLVTERVKVVDWLVEKLSNPDDILIEEFPIDRYGLLGTNLTSIEITRQPYGCSVINFVDETDPTRLMNILPESIKEAITAIRHRSLLEDGFRHHNEPNESYQFEKFCGLLRDVIESVYYRQMREQIQHIWMELRARGVDGVTYQKEGLDSRFGRVPYNRILKERTTKESLHVSYAGRSQTPMVEPDPEDVIDLEKMELFHASQQHRLEAYRQYLTECIRLQFSDQVVERWCKSLNDILSQKGFVVQNLVGEISFAAEFKNFIPFKVEFIFTRESVSTSIEVSDETKTWYWNIVGDDGFLAIVDAELFPFIKRCLHSQDAGWQLTPEGDHYKLTHLQQETV